MASVSEAAAVHTAYAQQYAIFERVGDAVASDLRHLCREVGIKAIVTARPKEVDTVVRKVTIRGKGPLAEIRDRAGARATTMYVDDAERLSDAIEASVSFDVRKREDKAAELGPDRVGYLGTHLDVVVAQDRIVDGDRVDGDLWCEIQVRSECQSLWAEVSHQLGYKKVEMPEETERRLNRLMGVLELVDEEFVRTRARVREDPQFHVLHVVVAAQIRLARIVATRPDHATTWAVVPDLMSMYSPEELERIDEILDDFVASEGELLDTVYQREVDATWLPFLRQPEGLLIFERLQTDSFAAAGAWPESLEPGILEDMAHVLGTERAVRAFG